MLSDRPLNIFVLNGIFRARSPRRMVQRRGRNRYRIHRNTNVQFINNEDTLNRITNLPTQIANDPYINGFFN
ncbi:10263_t:CDS:1, partial [Funneliformis caledonium]